MTKKFNILSTGSEIKRVYSKGPFGQLYLPKELRGKFVRVSLLTPKEEKELIKKHEKAEKFKKEREKAVKELEEHYKKLNKLRKK